MKREWQKWETSVSYTENAHFFPHVSPRFLSHRRYSGDTLVLLLRSLSLGASQLSLIIIIFLFLSVSSVFFPLSLFLFVSWLTEWVSRRLCCVVFDSSLGAKLSLTQLLGPTVFLKSVSINIIMACSRRHWIFYCNVQQNITPTLNATQRKSYCVTETFYFDWKVFVRSVSSVEVFVFLLCFPFCALGKVLGPRLIKWLRVFFFLSGIYYWHFPGIGLGTRCVGALYSILQLLSQENHVVQSCRLNSLVQHPHRIWLWLEETCVFRRRLTYLLYIKKQQCLVTDVQFFLCIFFYSFPCCFFPFFLCLPPSL